MVDKGMIQEKIGEEILTERPELVKFYSLAMQ
ncbi:hypothetical protein BH18THE1_BH18THE1_12070 [soil metagenome]